MSDKVTIIPAASRSDMLQGAHWRAASRGQTIQEFRRTQQAKHQKKYRVQQIVVRAALKGDLAGLVHLGYSERKAIELIAVAQKA